MRPQWPGKYVRVCETVIKKSIDLRLIRRIDQMWPRLVKVAEVCGIKRIDLEKSRHGPTYIEAPESGGWFFIFP
jgi:hypothetical protein